MDDEIDFVNDEWEIDDTLIEGFLKASEARTGVSDASSSNMSHSKPKLDSFLRISMEDLDANQNTSRALPYKRIELRN